MSIRIAIVQFPGSNCERETMLAVKRAGMEPIEFLWNESREKLANFDGYIIVGGFSYEDRSRAGVIAALDPVMQIIKEESRAGKPVLGICNGAQILVETGLVPGLENDAVGMALTDNKRVKEGVVLGTGYYNAWIHMRLSEGYQLNAFTQFLKPTDILEVPVAHGEGRFVIPPALLQEMQNNGQTVFQYCDAMGNILDAFPVNPNGSVANIAAVTNKAGNVMAMMPHPERTTKGDAIFQSMRAYIAKGLSNQVSPMYYQKRSTLVKKYLPEKKSHSLIIELMLTDNEAHSVEKVLNKEGMISKVKRYTYWEVVCDHPHVFESIQATEVLYNHRKEKSTVLKKEDVAHLLVFAKEDLIGQQKLQMLQHHFNIQGIRTIKRGILWQLEKNVAQDIIHSPLLFNPYAHDCYYYE